MNKERSHVHHVDRDTHRFLSQPGQLERDLAHTLPNDNSVQETITKISELDALTVRNVEARFLHPSIWISLIIIALIAILYLLF
jgi:hypothetical protein